MAKRIIPILLCICMILSVLTGCGTKQTETKQTEIKTEETAKPAEKTEEKSDPVPLRFILRGSAGERNVEFFENEFHEKMLEELNLDITVEWIPYNGDDKLATMMASGEKFAFQNTLSRNPSHAANGFLATIDEDLINEVAPAYVASRHGYDYTCVTYKGNIVTIPCGYGVRGGMQDNLVVRNDILNKVGWDYTQINTYEDLMAAIADVHEAFPDLYIIGQIHTLAKELCDVYAPDSYYDISITDLFTVDEKDPDSDEVISFYESEDFLNLVKIYREWYELGYITNEHVTGSPKNPKEEFANGNALLDQGSPSYIYNHKSANMGDEADLRLLKIGATKISVIKNDYDWGWAISVADQENVANYLKFINWIYESEDNYNFVLYGVEGKDWEWNADGTINKLTTELFFYTWMQSTLDWNHDLAAADPDEVAQYLAFDEDCNYSKLSGFGFDESNVSVEKAQVTAVINEKVLPLVYGVGDWDTEWPAVLQELKDAGLDAYHDEYQRQFTEFREAQRAAAK